MKRAAAALAAGVIGVVIVVLVAAGGSREPARPTRTTSAPTPAGTEQFGANVNLLFNGGQLSGAEVRAQVAALRTSGATVARSDALWEASEPAPPAGGIHRYRWAFDDLIAATLATHGLRWLPIIDYSAPWAQSIPGRDHSPPRSDADYAAYAAAVAARYGAGGSFWRQHPRLPSQPVRALEIWNEPDSPEFWVPAPNANRYGGLYLAARDAVHAVDPSARVLVGGLSGGPSFLRKMIAARPALRRRIDGVAIHPYGSTPGAVLARVARARHALDGLGLPDRPLYVTEFGWTTRPPRARSWLPARLRPGYVKRTLEGLGRSGCRIAAVILYTWFSPERNPGDSQQWFGISPPGAQASADVTAFKEGLHAARRSPPGSGGCR